MTDDQEAAAVTAIGDLIGYGRTMQLASEIWNRKMPGGAFALGACIALIEICPHPERDANDHCEWCCGAGWLTKRVAALARTHIADRATDDGVDPTTTDMLKPRGNGGVVSAEICFNSLLLVGASQAEVTEEQVAGWTQEQRDHAYNWAMRVHLNASDNDDVPVPPMPECLQRER